MNKILIIGNSLAAVKAIEDIRRVDGTSAITLLCTESLLPYDRFLLPLLIAGQIKEDQTHSIAHDFFTLNRVEVIANEKFSRISPKRCYVTTESKRQIDYDQLKIADLGRLMPLVMKGYQKKGVFDCALLSSIKELIKYLPFTDTAFVMVTNIQGFDMACALHGLGKEVVIVCSGAGLLSEIFDDETGSLLKQIVENKGMRVMTETSLEEILGNGEVKAVRLGHGKVIGAQMVIADFLSLDWRLIEGDGGFEKVEDDYFKREPPLKSCHFGLRVLKGFLTGFTQLPQGGREYLKFNGPQNIFKKIFAEGEFLVGAVLFNAPADEERLLKLIHEHIPVTGQEEALLGG